jgi:hypothetical protein
MTRRYVFVAALALTLGVSIGPPRPAARENLPWRLTDREFWRLAVESSEPDGYFRSDTLTSNELLYQQVIPELVERAKPGGVYLGVGPEQNFTYMAALRPPMAIIFDIRRGNMLVQLMYKALFELAKDRADFVSMLFSRPRPQGLGPASTAARLFSAFASARSDEGLYTRTLAAVEALLTKTHGLSLARKTLRNPPTTPFFARSASSPHGLTAGRVPGRSVICRRSQLPVLKDLQSRDPCGAGHQRLCRTEGPPPIAAYLKRTPRGQGLPSNVEQYLNQDGWDAFCRNVATLPLDRRARYSFLERSRRTLASAS